jgi:serine/threonine protein kinase
MGTLGPTSPEPDAEPAPASAETEARPASDPNLPRAAPDAERGHLLRSSLALLAGAHAGESGAALTLREAAFDALLPRAGQVVAGKYTVDSLMARGGMGAVYAATHRVTGKRLALKWMLPQLDRVPGATERFVREAQATARINHPNVVDIYDVGQEGRSIYLVMELLHGETLRARMRHGPMLPAECIALLMPALRGVAAAHSHGVIHRDLKPDNIFLCEGPDGEPREAKVLDFGISKFEADAARDAALTLSGTVLGTPYYMAPEQVRGLRDLDLRVDVYAFGVILYELLSGRRPFDADSYNGLILQIATEQAVPLALVHPTVPEALSAIVQRAMAREPDARFASVSQLAQALEPFAAGTSFRPSHSGTRSATSLTPADSVPAAVGIPRTPHAALAASSAAHRRMGVALLVVAMLGLSAAAAWLTRRHGSNAARVDPGTAQSADGAAQGTRVPVHLPTAPAPVSVQPSPLPTPERAPAALVPDAPAAPPADPQSARPNARGASLGLPTTGRYRRAAVRPGAPANDPEDRAPPKALPPPEAPVSAPQALPDDWDMRLRPVQAAPRSKGQPAGELGAEDFR